MARLLRNIAAAFDPAEKRRLGLFFAAVVALHLAGWAALLAYGMGNPLFLGLGFAAYFFGLRHAFDADHISAIDNTTRKLLAAGRRPVGVGFFFSLGHSTVVFLIALLLGLTVKSVLDSAVSQGGQLRNLGSLIGTGVSGFFLILIGVINLLVLLDIVRVYRDMRAGRHDRASLSHELVAGGLMTRVFGRLFRVVSESWHMYPIGFLFGLGFDTASEVALLGIGAGALANRVPFVAVLALPVIFAASMSLMDTIDGAFMAKAYAWAFSNPVRKVFYNLSVTGLSVFVALFVGVVELSQLLISELRLSGQPWDAVDGLDFTNMGFIIVGAFVLTWAGAFIVFKRGRIEERWGAGIDEQSIA
ncbi:MAG: HoxN/HupN/NixA family nickel/cobalt transporter [Candidatus Dormibacteria bacterium]